MSLAADENSIKLIVAGEELEIEEVNKINNNITIRTTEDIIFEPGQQRLIQVAVDRASARLSPVQKVFANSSHVLHGTSLWLAPGVINNRIYITNWDNISIVVKKGALVGYGSVNEYEIFNLQEFDEEQYMFVPDEFDKSKEF